MSSEGTSKYAIDLVFVVDVTGSMSPIIDEVKELVNGFSERLISTMSDEGKGLQDLWVRVIAYRDLGFEGPSAISASTFFELPEDESKLKEYVDGLTPSGGGSEPESGTGPQTGSADPWTTAGRGGEGAATGTRAPPSRCSNTASCSRFRRTPSGRGSVRRRG